MRDQTTGELIREIKERGIYLMLNKEKTDILFFAPEKIEDEFLDRIRESHDEVINYLNQIGYMDA